MNAVALCVRATLRRRIRSTVALAVLLAATTAIVATTAAGARRTDTALSRFLTWNQAPDGDLFPATETFGLSDDAPRFLPDLDIAASLPQVAAAGRSAFLLMTPAGPDGRADTAQLGTVNPLAATDDSMFRTIARPLVLRGRLPDSAAPLEVAVSPRLAARRHLRVGGRLRMVAYARSQWEDVVASAASAAVLEPAGPVVDLTVVGIVRQPADVQPVVTDQDVVFAGSENLYLGAGFWRVYGPQVATFGQSLAVRLREGGAGVPAFRRALDTAVRGELGFETGSDQHRAVAKTQRALHLQALALYLFAVIMAVAAVLIIGQTIARQVHIDAVDVETMSALGLTRSQLITVSSARFVLAAIGGAVGGALAAAAASTLLPIGLARDAEIHPGLAVNVAVVAGVAVAMLGLMTIRTAVPAVRAARRAGRQALLNDAPLATPSRVGDRCSRAGMPPWVVTGIRMALEPGRGRRSVPVRSAIAGAVFAVAALTAAAVFASNLSRVVASPRLQGWSWDAIAGNVPLKDADLEAHIEALASDPHVASFSYGEAQQLELDGLGVMTLGIERLRDDSGPMVLSGRVPTADDEIALAAKDLRRLHAALGSRIAAVSPSGVRSTFAVVGEVALPVGVTDSVGSGQGAVITWEAMRKLLPSVQASRLFVHYRPGTDQGAAFRSLRAEFGRTVLLPLSSPDVENLHRVDRLPYALSALLVLLAAATIGHTLVTGVHRWSRDLAVLKVLGVRPAQLGITVASMAATLVLIALAAGIPAGIVAGRWSWRLLASGMGLPASAITPALVLGLAVPAVIALAVSAAVVPGWLATRVKPAYVLQLER